MTKPDHTPGKALDDRLTALLEDAAAEASEAKVEYEAAKARHETARRREAAIRQAHESIHGTGQRPPDASQGEAVDADHLQRVRDARGEAA